MKLTYRLPSKAIQYGFVELEQELDEEIPPEMLGQHYVNVVHAFLESEQRGLAALTAAPQEAAPGNPKAAADRLAEDKKPRTVDEAYEMAKQSIENELGATEVDSHVHKYKYMDDDNGHSGSFCTNCGDPEPDDDNPHPEESDPDEQPTAKKPWEKKVDAPAKPWDNGGSAPKVASINW